MRFKKRLAVAGVAVIATLFVGSMPANAYYDSGVKSHGCGSQYGKLTAQIAGGPANTWAPGDWNSNGGSPQYHAHSSTAWLSITDMQNVGSGGGYWRLFTGDSARNVTPGCSAFG